MKEKKPLQEELLSGVEALNDELMDQVTGAGNPFEDVYRVPTQPIDDDLRNNG